MLLLNTKMIKKVNILLPYLTLNYHHLAFQIE